MRFDQPALRKMTRDYTLCTGRPQRCKVVCLDWFMANTTTSLRLWDEIFAFARYNRKERSWFARAVEDYLSQQAGGGNKAATHSTSSAKDQAARTDRLALLDHASLLDAAAFGGAYAAAPWRAVCESTPQMMGALDETQRLDTLISSLWPDSSPMRGPSVL